MTDVTVYDASSNTVDTGVVVHGKGCTHARKLRAPEFDPMYSTNVDTAADVFLEHNEDIMEIGDAAWDMTIYPCTGLVKKTTVLTEDNYEYFN